MEEREVEAIARVVHEANRAYCVTIGDESQVAWDDAPDWQRESAIAGVRAVIDGTADSPRRQHEKWAAHKVCEGWVWGPVKDAVAKTHPCLVPYDELPLAQKRKDVLFGAIVRALHDGVFIPELFPLSPALRAELALGPPRPRRLDQELALLRDYVAHLRDHLERVSRHTPEPARSWTYDEFCALPHVTSG